MGPQVTRASRRPMVLGGVLTLGLSCVALMLLLGGPFFERFPGPISYWLAATLVITFESAALGALVSGVVTAALLFEMGDGPGARVPAVLAAVLAVIMLPNLFLIGRGYDSGNLAPALAAYGAGLGVFVSLEAGAILGVMQGRRDVRAVGGPAEDQIGSVGEPQQAVRAGAASAILKSASEAAHAHRVGRNLAQPIPEGNPCT